jgi:hypothetical protein
VPNAPECYVVAADLAQHLTAEGGSVSGLSILQAAVASAHIAGSSFDTPPMVAGAAALPARRPPRPAALGGLGKGLGTKIGQLVGIDFCE